MSKIPEEVIVEWATKKKHINDRLNRIRKRLKKYERQKTHFELRIRLIQKFEKALKILLKLIYLQTEKIMIDKEKVKARNRRC